MSNIHNNQITLPSIIAVATTMPTADLKFLSETLTELLNARTSSPAPPSPSPLIQAIQPTFAEVVKKDIEEPVKVPEEPQEEPDSDPEFAENLSLEVHHFCGNRKCPCCYTGHNLKDPALAPGNPNFDHIRAEQLFVSSQEWYDDDWGNMDIRKVIVDFLTKQKLVSGKSIMDLKPSIRVDRGEYFAKITCSRHDLAALIQFRITRNTSWFVNFNRDVKALSENEREN